MRTIFVRMKVKCGHRFGQMGQITSEPKKMIDWQPTHHYLKKNILILQHRHHPHPAATSKRIKSTCPLPKMCLLQARNDYNDEHNAVLAVQGKKNNKTKRKEKIKKKRNRITKCEDTKKEKIEM